jgi:hypothetical protein
MLKASLTSDTIFTDVFLSKGTHDDHTAAPRVNVTPSLNETTLNPSNDENTDSYSESKIKFFYDMHEKKVMYAECDHGFVDMLLSFLSYPVCRVIKNGGAFSTCHISTSLNNLYSSAIDLGTTGFLTGRFLEETLLDPGLAPCRQVVEDREYVVEDDLHIHQASAMSMIKHWRRRDRKVKRRDITVGKHEVA